MKVAACLLIAGLALAGRARGDGAEPLTFERDIRPILKTHCFQCHGEDGQRKGGLDLRLKRLAEQGGDSGPALVPGKPDESLLVERLRSGETPPIDKKPPAEQIDIIARWIAAGAATARPEPQELGEAPLFTDEERIFWAFQPVRRPAIPPVAHPELVSTPVDALLLAKLEAAGLVFSPEADKPTLLRRAYFDLLGLPPTPEEIEAFVADSSPDAWPRLVEPPIVRFRDDIGGSNA